MFIGVIADDFTGGTDIASFLVKGGMSTLQLIGVPDTDFNEKLNDVDALVISLKSRSCPQKEAIDESLKALEFLNKHHCQHIIFKYCSTFDSTKEGNIGPVTDALMNALDEKFTIFTPALPVNGRTVYFGHLFVNGVLLNESPMKDHPLNPMTKSNVVDLVEMQSAGRCGCISHDELKKGRDYVLDKVNKLKTSGYKYAVVDAIDVDDLLTQAQIFKDFKFVTGGSGIGYALAKTLKGEHSNEDSSQNGYPNHGKTIILAGSCSNMTNRQVACYKEKAPSILVKIGDWISSENKIENYAEQIVNEIESLYVDKLAPLVYSTANSEELNLIKTHYQDINVSLILEKFFYALSKKLKAQGYNKYIVAGGETSGQVTKALGVAGFYIGPTIAPGVPWVKAVNADISLALKSGNFGDEQFFFKAQQEF